MSPQEMRSRTKTFSLRVFGVFRALPKTDEARIDGRQLLRCGTSVAANYRAVCRARTKKEFISKIGIVVEEADESVYWLEMLGETGIVRPSRLKELLREANEITSILVASQRTATGKRTKL